MRGILLRGLSFGAVGFAHLHAVADDIAGAQVFISGHFKQHGLELAIVGFALFVKSVFFHIGVDNLADVIVEATCPAANVVSWA